MFVITIPYMDLEQIYNSFQVPLWVKLRDYKYVVVNGDKFVKLEQVKDNRFLFHCSAEEFYDIWFDYFDLSTDYYSEYRKIRKGCKKLKIPANLGKGIHVINHKNKFEMYVYSKLSEILGFQNARFVLKSIAMSCGIEHINAMKEASRIKWYEFPSPELLLENIEKARYFGKTIFCFLKKLCKAIVYDNFDFESKENERYFLFVNHNLNVFLRDKDVDESILKNFKTLDEWDEYISKIENKSLTFLYLLNCVEKNKV